MKHKLSPLDVQTRVTVIENDDGTVSYHFDYDPVTITLPDGTKVQLTLKSKPAKPMRVS